MQQFSFHSQTCSILKTHMHKQRYNIIFLCTTTQKYRFKGVITWEIKIPLIFWHIRGHCTIKTSCKFQNSKLVILKSVYIEANLPKRQRVKCVTLWRNGVPPPASMPDQRLLLHHWLLSPAHWFTHVEITRETNAGLRINQTIKMALKTRRCSAVPSCGKTQSLNRLPSDPNIKKE